MTKQIRNLIGVALLLAAISACAQSSNAMRVKVPFPFVTAGKSWPAADYSVQVRTDNGLLTLSSPGIASATVLTTVGASSGEGRAFLRFQRSGDRWVLQAVSLDGNTHVLPMGELEKELSNERVSLEAQPSVEP